MISAGTFARQNSIWDSCTPALGEVVRWANENRKSLTKSVRSNSDPARHSLLAEVAFLSAKNSVHKTKLTPQKIEQEARSFVVKLPRSEMAKEPLSKDEWIEVDKLASVIKNHLEGKIGIYFNPTIPGCGVVDATIADITCEREIIEVKAVTRPYRSMDYRQVLTYVAMLHASGTHVDTVTLLNPRRSNYVTIDVEDLAATASGKSKVEVMHDIATWMIGLQVSA